MNNSNKSEGESKRKRRENIYLVLLRIPLTNRSNDTPTKRTDI